MVNYKELYLRMFRGAEDARRILLEQDLTIQTAIEVVRTLEQAQLECEELYISACDT